MLPSDRKAEARERYADELAAAGPAWVNAADSVRAGYSNVWIAPALRVIEATLNRCPEPDDD